MNVKISFIIPVFNKNEHQLTRCLNSINRLISIKYEIILVNDGSKKKFSKIYERLAQEYSCRYYYQKNNGVSSARNLGLKKAAGEYVFFVDADDYINVSKINTSDFQKRADLIMYDVKVHYKNGQETIFKLEHVSKHPTKEEVLKLSLKNGIMNWSVAKLYSRKYLLNNNLFFNETINSGEDFDFITRVIMHNPSMSYLSKVVYVYLIDENTGKTRVLKHPLESLNDEVIIYKHRLAISKILDIKEQYYLTENTINAIFEVYAVLVRFSLVDAKKYNPTFNKSIKKLNISNSSLSKLTRFKIFLIKNKCFWLIQAYSDTRYVYKKIFKKNNLI